MHEKQKSILCAVKIYLNLSLDINFPETLQKKKKKLNAKSKSEIGSNGRVYWTH